MLHITSFFAGIFAFQFILLSVHVMRYRRKYRIPLGPGNKELSRRIRAHGNFAEYVPFALLLLGICELSGTGELTMAALGLLLLVARLSHAYGVLVMEPKRPMKMRSYRMRALGMTLTWAVIGVAGLIAIFGPLNLPL